MINPQLMGLNNFDKVPTPQELWKNEKQKYRHWIILFGIGLLIVFSFCLAGTIWNLLEKDAILAQLKIEYKNRTDVDSYIQGVWLMRYIVSPAFVLSLIGSGLVLYIVTVIKSYLKHSFARISLWLFYIVGMGTVLSFVQIILFLTSYRFGFIANGTILVFISHVIFIVFYFSSSTKVSRIRRQFAYSEYVQKLQKDERFAKFQEQLKDSLINSGINPGINPGQSNSPFGPVLHQPPKNPNASIVADVSAPLDLKLSEQYNKLKTMSLIKLKEVAQRLSISGAETMKKEELIDTIIRVSSPEKK